MYNLFSLYFTFQLPPLIAPIDTINCGSTKACYRVPEGCWEPYCDYIATWQHVGGNAYKFEIGAMTHGMGDRHVSVALSDDIRWVRCLSISYHYCYN